MASGLATFRTLTPLRRWSTRRFAYLWCVGSIVSCASGDDEHRPSPSSEWGWGRRMGDHIMGCRARGGRGAFMVRSWVGRVQNLGCISGFTPSLVAPKLPVHRCTPSGDVRYRLVHHNHIGSGLFRAPAATPLSLSGHPGVGRVSRAETARLARAIVLRTLARVCSRFAERLGALTGAAAGRVGAAGPRWGCQGEGSVSRAETARLVAGLGLGSLIWMVNDFPDGLGALTKR